MFKKLSAKFHLAMGLTSIVTTLLLGAIFLNFVPDRTQAVIQGRVALAESIASGSTLFLLNKDYKSITRNLEFNVDRNAELIAATIKRPGDTDAVVIGEEKIISMYSDNKESSASRIVLPILQNEKMWGEIVLYFVNPDGTGQVNRIKNSRYTLLAFVSLFAFLLFYLYLGKMLKALNPSQAVPGRVRSALDTLAEALLVIDRKSNVVLANKAFQYITGESAEALMGKPANGFKWHSGTDHPQDSTKQQNTEFPWDRALKNNETLRSEALWLQARDGVWHKFLANCSPIASGNSASGVLISLDDVTELERTENELRLARDAAEEANKAKSNFLSNMSHEIRTPMTAILGFTEVLKRSSGQSDTHWQKHLNTISSSGKHLLELINELLDLSKVESGALEVESMDCAVHVVTHDVVQVLRVRAEEKGIQLNVVIAEKLPELIQSDSSRLRQIITNLVGNAIKFTEHGGVEIILRTVEIDGKPKFAIDVKDSGIGMDEQQQAAVFQPFVQADASITRRFGGTGLGLAISRDLTRALGGDITVTSEAGVGTTFTALIDTGPLDNVKYLSVEEIKEHMVATDTAAHTQWEFPPSKLLVIDDAAENRELITLVLNDLGLATETAENGAIGVEMATAEHYDVILSDIQMPVMNGYDAAKAMRSAGLSQPIIALTANAMKGYEQTILQAGFSHYMTKPIDFDALASLLAQLLNGKAVSRENTPAQNIAPATTAGSADRDNKGESQSPIYSRLGGSEKLAPIVDKFITRLRTQMPAIEAAFEEKDYTELAALGHWLKGSGGTVGFDELSTLASSLENNAKSANNDEIALNLAGIRQMSKRLRGGTAALPTGSDRTVNHNPDFVETTKESRPIAVSPVFSTLLSKDQTFRPIVIRFLPRLDAQLSAMEQAISDGNYAVVGELAHWLKGSGGTVGFDVFTKPAADMEHFAREKDREKLFELLQEIRTYADNIVIPGNDENGSDDIRFSA